MHACWNWGSRNPKEYSNINIKKRNKSTSEEKKRITRIFFKGKIKLVRFHVFLIIILYFNEELIGICDYSVFGYKVNLPLEDTEKNS